MTVIVSYDLGYSLFRIVWLLEIVIVQFLRWVWMEKVCKAICGVGGRMVEVGVGARH